MDAIFPYLIILTFDINQSIVKRTKKWLDLFCATVHATVL